MLIRRRSSDGVVYYVSPLLERAGVPHAFSTRQGGVSAEPFDSLNLGNPSESSVIDDSDRIAQNYRLLQRAIGCDQRLRCYVQQVHGGDSVTANRGAEFARDQCADAIISDDPARLLSIRTADCVPILVAARDGACVAAIHAGWRGIVANVIGRTIERLGSRKLVAAIGPCISLEHFEVGDEVLAAFARLFADDPPLRRASNGKGHVDLRETAKRQLVAAGVSADAVDLSDRCTFRDSDEFFSHRRERGVTGRHAAVIGASAS